MPACCEGSTRYLVRQLQFASPLVQGAIPALFQFACDHKFGIQAHLEALCQCSQHRSEWLIVLQCRQHASKDQHHRKWGPVLREIEPLQAQFADAINSKSGQNMCDVMGLLESMCDVIARIINGCWVDQRVGSDSLADQLIGITASERALGKSLEGGQVNLQRASSVVHKLGEVGIVQQMAAHLLGDRAVLHTGAYCQHVVQ